MNTGQNLSARLLAATKFLVPVLPGGTSPRPRLHAALDAAAELPLTVVVGVPGAGKRVMHQSWPHDRAGSGSAWLSCDARDADPATFFRRQRPFPPLGARPSHCAGSGVLRAGFHATGQGLGKHERGVITGPLVRTFSAPDDAHAGSSRPGRPVTRDAPMGQ